MNTLDNETANSGQDADTNIDAQDCTTDADGAVLVGDDEALFLCYCDAIGIKPTDATLDDAQWAYEGDYKSTADFAESRARETAGIELDALPSWLSSSISWADAWHELRSDYAYSENLKTRRLMFFSHF